MANSLGLDDDLDPNCFIAGVEKAFGTKFAISELIEFRTVGDIHELLLHRLATGDCSTGGCAGAMAFYRLRRALGGRSRPDRQLTPATQVSQIAPNAVKRLFKTLASGTGLNLPRPAMTWVGHFGLVMLLLGLFAMLLVALAAPGWFAVPTGAAVIGILLLVGDPGKVPEDCLTFGALAKKVAGLNFGTLIDAGAGIHHNDVWNALVEVTSERTNLPKVEIRPDTVLLESQLESA